MIYINITQVHAFAYIYTYIHADKSAIMYVRRFRPRSINIVSVCSRNVVTCGESSINISVI